MWVNGDYRNGISVMDRLRPVSGSPEDRRRDEWLAQPIASQRDVADGRASRLAPRPGSGLSEAARGALGHWLNISNSKIARYQVITPTAWNASPMDDNNQPGPIEQALVGTPVAEYELSRSNCSAWCIRSIRVWPVPST